MPRNNIKPYTFRFLMPQQCDLGGQVQNAYPNMGFDKLSKNTDIESNIKLLDLKQHFPKNDLEEFVNEANRQNNITRDWLKHLFGKDYEEINQEKKDIYWRYLLYFTEHDIFEDNKELFNKKLSDNRYGSHIATNKKDNFTVLRIKESSYEKLYKVSRETIKKLLELI